MVPELAWVVLGEGRSKSFETEPPWGLHELGRHARAHCIVCVCAANSLLPFSPSLSLLPFPPFEMLPQTSVKVQVSLCVCTAAVGIFPLLGGAWFESK